MSNKHTTNKPISLTESIADILLERKSNETKEETDLKEYDEVSGRRSKEFKSMHTIVKYDHDDMEGIGEEDEEDENNNPAVYPTDQTFYSNKYPVDSDNEDKEDKEDDEEDEEDDLQEATLSGIAELVQTYDYGVISAEREGEDCGMGRKYSRGENRRRTAMLKKELDLRGYSITKIEGFMQKQDDDDEEGNDVKEVFTEDSFFVVDMDMTGNLERDIIRLGERFEQDTVIFGEAGGPAHLIGTNDCPGEPDRGERFSIGHFRGGRSGAYFSKVRNRPFVFEDFEAAYDLVLEGTIDEEYDYDEDEDDDMDEKRMSTKAKKAAAKYRRKNKRKLKKYRKKRAKKLKSGAIRVDKKRSRQMKKARKKPGISEAKKLKKKKGDPCWKGYVQVGTKMKNGKEVPNCVPIDKAETEKEKQGITEKSVSKAQQKLMGMAYAVKKGEMDRDEASEEVLRLADTMSMSDLKDYAETDRGGLPGKKNESLDESTSTELMAAYENLSDVDLPYSVMNSLKRGEMPDPEDVDEIDNDIDREMLLSILGELVGARQVQRMYGVSIDL